MVGTVVWGSGGDPHPSPSVEVYVDLPHVPDGARCAACHTSAVNEAHCRIIPLAEMDMLIFTPQKVYLPLMIQGGSRWIPKETWVEELNSH